MATALPALGSQIPPMFSLTGVLVFLAATAALMAYLSWALGLLDDLTSWALGVLDRITIPSAGAQAPTVEAQRPRRYGRRHAANRASRKRATA